MKTQIPATQKATSYLSPEQVAQILGMSVKTLADWRSKRIGPPVMRFQGVIRYPAGAFRSTLREKGRIHVDNRV